MKCQILFSRRNKIRMSTLSSAELALGVNTFKQWNENVSVFIKVALKP